MRWPRVRTVLAAIAILCVALVAIGVALLRTGRVHEWIRQQAVTRLSALVDGDVKIGAVSGSLLHDVAVHDLRIRQHGQLVIAASVIEAHYDPLALARGRLQFADVRVAGLDLRLVRGADGWNLEHLARPRASGGAAPLVLTLRRLRVENGRVRIETGERPPISLDEIWAEADVAFNADGVTTSVERASVRDATSGDVMSEVAGDVSVGRSSTTIRGVRAHADGLDVRVDGTWQGSQIDGLTAEADLQGWRGAPLRAIEPDVTRLPRLTGHVSASGASAAIAATWTLDLDGQCASTGRLNVDLTRTPLPVSATVTAHRCDPAAIVGQPDLPRMVDGQLSATGLFDRSAPARSTATFGFDGHGVTVRGYQADRLSVHGGLRQRQLTAAAVVHAYDADATVQLHTAISDAGAIGDLHGSGSVSHVNAARLPIPQTAGLQTAVSGDYTAAFDAHRWRVDLIARPSEVGAVSVGTGTAVHAAMVGARLDLSVRGHLGATGGAPGGLPSPVPIAMAGEVEASATVPDVHAPFRLASVTGSARAALTGRVAASGAPATVNLDVALQDAVADVRSLSLTSAATTITASGSLALDATARRASELTFDVNATDLSAWSPLGVAGVRGTAHASGDVTGPAGEWRIGAQLNGQQLGYGDRFAALTTNGSVSAMIPGTTWRSATGTLVLDGAFIDAAGQQMPHAAMTATYAHDEIELSGQVTQAARALDFSSAIVFQPKAREVHLRTFTLSGAGGGPWRLTGGHEAVVRMEAGAVTIHGLTLERGVERVTADGTLATAAGGARPSDLTVRTSALNVGDALLLATGTRRMEGTADTTVHLTGTLAEPAGEATLQVHNATVSGIVVPTMEATVHAAGGAANVEAHVVEQSGAALNVAGHLPLAATAGAADLHVTSSAISLGLLQAATTAVSDVHGTAGLDLHVSGLLADLDVTGSVHVSEAAFRVASSGVSYSGLNADVQCQDGWATVTDATIADADGHRATVGGRFALRAVNGSRDVHATLHSDGMHLLDNDLGEVEVSAQLDLSGSLNAAHVTGTVQATKARLEVDQILRALGATNSAPPAPPPPSSEAARALSPPAPVAPAPRPDAPVPAPERLTGGPWANATIDVNLRMPDNVVLRGRDLRIGAGGSGLGDMNLTVGGVVTMRKRPGSDPVVVGAVDAVRGFYEFQGRRFTVTRGSAVQFRGDRPINPSIDVTGERDVSGITARVRVTGTARRPALKLSSQPPLDEGDVLALIVFNQPLNELGASQQVDLLQRAGDMALGAIASTLTQSIGHALDVDLFEVRAPSGSTPGEVNVGTQLGDRVFVGFRQQFGSTDASRLSLEYRLTEALRLLTSFGQGASTSEQVRDREAAGVDLVYTIKY